jgi:hypothetical protein
MRRCYQCNGRCGLVRHRLGLKQFCSTRCLDRYRADIERTTVVPEIGHGFSGEGCEDDTFARVVTAEARLP